jgi:DNA-binding response OmpR family regulator
VATVLVIDDDEMVRTLVAHKLALHGHRVVTEADGDTGLVTARDLDPDVIVLDWMMPFRSGVEVCRELRADPATARSHIILLTAKAQDADVDRAYDSGVDDYLVKPFSPRELVSRIETALEAAHS